MTSHPVTLKSPATDAYNCVAYAACIEDVWWWPDPWNQYYWPENAPREDTVSAFIKAFATLGYEPVDVGMRRFDPNVSRLAVFSRDGKRATHVCREVDDGLWVSKLGRAEDVEHGLDSLGEYDYGTVHTLLVRPQEAS
ncbi:MAG TPA: hypothetical protein VF432_01840 [Thermoanaerobaculia bacterium]